MRSMITEESLDKAACEFAERFSDIAPMLYLVGAFKNGAEWALKQVQSEAMARIKEFENKQKT